MPSDDLDELVRGAAQRGHPVGEAQVELCAAPLWHLPVRDVADQDVLERILVLAGDARRGIRSNEVLPYERRELWPRIRFDEADARTEMAERAGPEDGADDGRLVRDALRVGLETVEPRADQALQVRRHRQRLERGHVVPARAVERSLVAQHADRLLEEQWVSARIRDESRCEGGVRELRVADERGKELRSRPLWEDVQLDAIAAGAVRELRLSLDELRPRRPHDKQRRFRLRRRDELDQLD